MKHNILRRLASHNLRVAVVPANTPAEEVLQLDPDGIFLSNGPGDPAGVPYAAGAVAALLESGLPMFGICLGHQIIGLALGAHTFKLKFGHHGGNQPVSDVDSANIQITAQNHNYAVDQETLPPNVEITHLNLNDGTLEGMRLTDRPVFCVQYHPEASPGPHDADLLFARFAQTVHEFHAARTKSPSGLARFQFLTVSCPQDDRNDHAVYSCACRCTLVQAARSSQVGEKLFYDFLRAVAPEIYSATPPAPPGSWKACQH